MIKPCSRTLERKKREWFFHSFNLGSHHFQSLNMGKWQNCTAYWAIIFQDFKYRTSFWLLNKIQVIDDCAWIWSTYNYGALCKKTSFTILIYEETILYRWHIEIHSLTGIPSKLIWGFKIFIKRKEAFALWIWSAFVYSCYCAAAITYRLGLKPRQMEFILVSRLIGLSENTYSNLLHIFRLESYENTEQFYSGLANELCWNPWWILTTIHAKSYVLFSYVFHFKFVPCHMLFKPLHLFWFQNL